MTAMTTLTACRVAPPAPVSVPTFRPAVFAATLTAVTAAWVAAIVWALTFVPATVWAALAVAAVAVPVALRAWCDIVHGTAR